MLRRLLVLAGFALASCAPTLAHAQKRQTYPAICLSQNLRRKSTDSLTKIQCAHLKATIDSANKALALSRKKPPVVVVVPPVVDSTPPVVTPPPVTPPPQPTPPPSAPPIPVVTGLAELPRTVPVTTYPTSFTRDYAVAGGGSFQTILDTAKAGDRVRLRPGATYVGTFIWPKKLGSAWITIQTDTFLPAPGTRMTPTIAAALRLTKIQTNVNNAAAIGTADSSHHLRLVGVEISMTSTPTLMNMLVRFGDNAANGQTVLSHVPSDFILDRVYVHGSSTQNLKRCVTLNSKTTSIIDSWLGECHDHGSDSQATLGYNGPGPFLIQNNHLESGHEVVMWGGSDPTSAAFSPADITLVGNHITRPAAWKTVWQTKNVIETKNVRWYLVQGNVIENTWADAQTGFCVVMKSENQDATAPYSQSADITIRYNIIRNCGSGLNFSGAGSSSNPNVHATRFTIYDNIISNLNVAPYTGDGVALQLLSDLSDAQIFHNTWLNSTASNQAISFDGAPQQRLVFHSNIVFNGTYGVKGGGTPSGTSTLATYAPGAVFKNNAIVGGNCATLPITTTCPSSITGAAGVPAFDGRAYVGADTAYVNALTANVVVAP